MNAALVLLLVLGTVLPVPPIPGCHWVPSDAPRPVVVVVRHAPGHTVLAWHPGAGVTGVAVVAIREREQAGLLDTLDVPALATIEDRAAATGYLVFERRGWQVGCSPVPLLPWNWRWLPVVAV